MTHAKATARARGAIDAHARNTGLLPADVALADAHPALARFADPAWCPHLAAGITPTPFVEPRAGFYERHASWSTRYLADLYQDESEEARKQRALAQTPDYVARLLLHCSWTNAVHALDREPYPQPPEPLPLRLIDPACGGGHILLDAYADALVSSQIREREGMVRDALAVVHGVDLDPFAVLIARYRLLAAACRHLRCRFDQAPRDLPVNIAAGDALLQAGGRDLRTDATAPSDVHEHPGILDHGRYDVVVANPPYVTPKDAAARDAIRAAYPEVCHRQYQLGVPFEQLMHQLAVPGGWVSRITSNAFMKREFGRKIIEDFYPRVDLRWIIDTSGAYIPGHGTPTVILVSRNRPPTGEKVHVVSGLRGEPSKPADPGRGLVWTAIEDRVRAVEQARRVSIDMEREADLCGPEVGIGDRDEGVVFAADRDGQFQLFPWPVAS